MLARMRWIRRASRGRLLVPLSWREVDGKAAFMLVVGFVGAPLDGCDGCDAGCGCVGGLSVGAFAVAGGVEIPLGTFSATGEAMLLVVWVKRMRVGVIEFGSWRSRREVAEVGRALGVHRPESGEENVTQVKNTTESQQYIANV